MRDSRQCPQNPLNIFPSFPGNICYKNAVNTSLGGLWIF